MGGKDEWVLLRKSALKHVYYDYVSRCVRRCMYGVEGEGGISRGIPGPH